MSEDDAERDDGPRIRELAQSQLVKAVGLVAVIATTASAAGVWAYTVAQRLDRQQELLERVVAFMDEQTQARRAQGARERQRKELCAQGALKAERCLYLPSDLELQAMER